MRIRSAFFAVAGLAALGAPAGAGAYCPFHEGYTVLYARCNVEGLCKAGDPVFYSQPILLKRGQSSTKLQLAYGKLADKTAKRPNNAYWSNSTSGCYDTPGEPETVELRPMREKSPKENYVLLKIEVPDGN